MSYTYKITEISKEQALEMIQKYHYSNTLPKLNKYFIGFFLDGELVGVVTLGWGTRPRHTIQRIFPSLDTKDYLEIGRMCMTEEMPRNSESQMLSQLVKWIKWNIPELKVLFTWADGMIGKVGYVYQASNFIYAGYSGGEMYMKDGVKIHVRQMKSILLPEGVKDERITVRPTLEQMKKYNIQHYKGKQYRYLLFLCDRREKRRLLNECLLDLTEPRPKESSLCWTIKNINTGKWDKTTKPPYLTDFDQSSKRLVGVNMNEEGGVIMGKKFKITVEEDVSQTFEIEAETMEDAEEKARSLYKAGRLILDNPNLISAQMMAETMDGSECTPWNEI